MIRKGAWIADDIARLEQLTKVALGEVAAFELDFQLEDGLPDLYRIDVQLHCMYADIAGYSFPQRPGRLPLEYDRKANTLRFELEHDAQIQLKGVVKADVKVEFITGEYRQETNQLICILS